MVRVFVQARMSSERFPGKVLAPFNGIPILTCVIERVNKVIPSSRIVVLTSMDQSDDPLVCYMQNAGISVHRGALENVFGRFQSCLREYPCRWFFRICADSPLLDSAVLKTMLNYNDRLDVDLVTNVFPRTFPKGQSVEMLNAKTFAGIDLQGLASEQQEHITKVYYEKPDEFKIINVESSDRSLATINFSVDTVADLCRLQDFPKLD